MKKIHKTLIPYVSIITIFTVYFLLSLSCATNKKNEIESGVEISVETNLTENNWLDYDITVVSTNKCPSRILKLVQKDKNSNDNQKVLYAISAPNDTEVYQTIKKNGVTKKIKLDPELVTASELKGKYLINEEDAKAAVKFINELEKKFKTNRKDDGVLDKFEIFKVERKSDAVWVKTSETEIGSIVTKEGEYKTIEWNEKKRIFFIQHSTSYGKDEILYSANAPIIISATGDVSPMPPIIITLEEVLAIRDALSK